MATRPVTTHDAPLANAYRLGYVLGVGAQTCLWFLLFLAICVAAFVGTDITEFRYVGF